MTDHREAGDGARRRRTERRRVGGAGLEEGEPEGEEFLPAYAPEGQEPQQAEELVEEEEVLAEPERRCTMLIVMDGDEEGDLGNDLAGEQRLIL